jgi:hypothetical protein
VIPRSPREEISLGVRIGTLAHRRGIPDLRSRDTKNLKLILRGDFLSEAG